MISARNLLKGFQATHYGYHVVLIFLCILIAVCRGRRVYSCLVIKVFCYFFRPQAALVALSTALKLFCAPIPFRSFLSNWTKCSSSRAFATLLPSPPIVVIQD